MVVQEVQVVVLKPVPPGQDPERTLPVAHDVTQAAQTRLVEGVGSVAVYWPARQVLMVRQVVFPCVHARKFGREFEATTQHVHI